MRSANSLLYLHFFYTSARIKKKCFIFIERGVRRIIEKFCVPLAPLLLLLLGNAAVPARVSQRVVCVLDSSCMDSSKTCKISIKMQIPYCAHVTESPPASVRNNNIHCVHVRQYLYATPLWRTHICIHPFTYIHIVYLYTLAERL